MKRKINPIFFFYLLLFYIILQFVWWMIHIYDLGQRLNEEDKELSLIFGEGAVFLVILLIGFLYTVRAFRKELDLSKQQNNFLLAVTHELKTPLASIKLFFQTLRRKELSEEKRLDLITRGGEDVDRLNNMIENLLLSARFEGDALIPYMEEVEFHDFMVKLTDKLKFGVAKDHFIHVKAKGSIILNSDPQFLNSIFINLIENACKYSPAGSDINVSIVEKGKEIEVSIQDEGQGIPEKDIKKVFSKFYRAQNEETRTTKGTGLGLYIVYELLNKINGSITVKSHFPNGSIFITSLQIN
jgi:two-component system, OmpR family, phosphate regulon sensor histidine kinase PhoR